MNKKYLFTVFLLLLITPIAIYLASSALDLGWDSLLPGPSSGLKTLASVGDPKEKTKSGTGSEPVSYNCELTYLSNGVRKSQKFKLGGKKSLAGLRELEEIAISVKNDQYKLVFSTYFANPKRVYTQDIFQCNRSLHCTGHRSYRTSRNPRKIPFDILDENSGGSAHFNGSKLYSFVYRESEFHFFMNDILDSENLLGVSIVCKV